MRVGRRRSARGVNEGERPPDSIGHVIFGQVIATEPRDCYLARVIAVAAGVPVEVPALTVNRLCGSGLQAVLSAAQCLLLGDAEIVVAGGAEVMSRAPYQFAAVRWGSALSTRGRRTWSWAR